MQCKIGRYIRIVAVCTLLIILSTPVWAQEAPNWEAPDQWFVYAVLFIVLIGSVLILLFIRAAVFNSKWSLADALSEEVKITAVENNKFVIEKGKPVDVTEMRGSASRLIALMGMFVILLMFLGFGTFAIHSFAFTGEMPEDINKAVNFLLAGLILFAPYVVNKFSDVFEILAPPRS
jgi:uncharacterized membrane protein